MKYSFIHCFQSEWQKQKGSLASWIVIIGGFFVPALMLIMRLYNYRTLKITYDLVDFWMQNWRNNWQYMVGFLLPTGIILATSLITQIEYKNNAWKQVHTLPLKLSTIFFAKLAVILTMVLQFFILFNIGNYLAAIIPYLLISGVPFPKEPFPFKMLLQQNAFYFIGCLPIVALQYLLALTYKNFIVPIGIGFVFWIAMLIGNEWAYAFINPYSYCLLYYMHGNTGISLSTHIININYMAIGYFIAILTLAYILYVSKKDKS